MTAPRATHVVFVHGFLSSAKVWRRFTDLIAYDPELAGIRIHPFQYDSPLFRLRPDRRIPDLDDIADQLRTYLQTELHAAEHVVLVTHSQGGIVVQRFLARSLARGEGHQLARIKRIVMYACPNSGSNFLLSLRQRFLFWGLHAQERPLRPIDREVAETHETVLRAIVNADGCTEAECRIPIEAYGGTTDRVVPPKDAVLGFTSDGTLDGDHFSVIRPVNRDSQCYRVVKNAILTVVAENAARAPADADPAGERLGRISVAPPFGRLDATLHGRDGLIAAIMNASRPKVHVLAGLGGSGKSRLALEIAHRTQEAGWLVFWISLPQINSGTREVATQLGASDSQVDRAWRGEASPTDLLWRRLNACEQRWLLVFDNADNPRHLGPLDGPVSDGTGWLRLPASDRGVVLVTSRDRDETTWGPWCTLHLVPPLGDSDGAAVLLDRAGTVGGTHEQARLLSAQLGGLPLALRSAADYLKSVSSTTIRPGGPRIDSFDDYRAAVKQRFESPAGGVQRDLNEPLGLEIVQSVFNISLELLTQRGLAEAAPLLKVFACLNIAPIPYNLLLKCDVLAASSLFTDFPSARRQEVLESLVNLGLAEPYELTSTDDAELAHVLSLHPLVHGLLRDDADVRRRRAEYYRLAVELLLAAVQNADPDLPESWGIWAVIAPHAIEVSQATLVHADQMSDRQLTSAALELTRLTSRYLIMTGLLGPANELVQSILGGCQSFGFDCSDREILALRHESARIALEQSDPAAAEEELRRVVAERTAILGDRHADTLASLHKLARAILDQHRWADAEQSLRSVVQAENTVRGPEHSDTMVVRHSLARSILAQGRAAEAEAMIRDILRVRDLHWSRAHPETLYARQTLARSLLEQDKTGEAEREIRDALSDAAERLDGPRAMSLRSVLATVLLMEGRTSEAVTELTTLLADRTRVLGATHPETERTSHQLDEAQKIIDQPD